MAVILLTVVSSGAIVFGFLDERQRILDLAGDRALQSVQAIATEQTRVIDSARSLLIAVAELPGVRTRDPEACTPAVVRLRERLPAYVNFSVADLDGTVWCSGLPQTLPLNFADRAWFLETVATGDFVTSEYLVSRTTGVPIVSLSYPLLGPGGRMAGVVFTAVSLEWFQRLSVADALPANSSMTLFDGEGTVLARLPSEGDWVGFDASDTPLAQLALDSGTRGSAVAVGLGGTRKLFTFLELSPLVPGLTVSVGIPLATAYADARAALARELVVLLVAATLLLLLLWWGAERYVLSSVRTLLSTTSRLRDGDLSVRTGMSGRGELERLGRSFDAMAQELQNQTTLARRALDDLSEQEERYRLLTEASRDLVALHEPDRTYRFVSPAARSMLGYDPSELVGSQPDALIHPQDLAAIAARDWTEPTTEPTTSTVEHRMQHRDGSYVWVETLVQPITDAAGQVRLLQSTSRDVTFRKEAEIRLAELNENLQRSNRELQEFTSVASHDLQEPLRKIQAFGDRLDRKYGSSLDEGGQAYLEKMRDAAKRMQTLINDLLAYSRVTTQARPFQEIDLEEVLRETLYDLEHRIAQTHGTVEIGALPSVHADPMQMGSLFQNLIGNALKYHRAGVPPDIEVRGHVMSDGSVQIEVSDNGIGFEEKYLDRIFTPFQRLHGRGTFEGTGMGLAICRKIVERHGGGLTATSEPGKGSTFTVTLPAGVEEGSV